MLYEIFHICIPIYVRGALYTFLCLNVRLRPSLQSLASAHPRNFLLNSQAHLGMGENLARCHRGWHRVRKFLKIWSPRLPEMVFTAPHSGRLYKVVPRPHKTSTCSKLFACCGKILPIYLSTKSAHLHTCDFCKSSLHTCTPEILSCTPEISSKTAILCSLDSGPVHMKWAGPVDRADSVML